MIQTASYNGMSQDLTYGDDGECTFMNNVSIDQMKYEELATTYVSAFSLGVTDTITHMLETPAGVISCGNIRVFLGGGDKSAVVAGATRVEFMMDASGNQKNYFFQNANVQVTDTNVTTVVNTEAKPVSGLTTATCVVYKTILYAVGGIIYSYDTTADTIGTALNTLTNGVTVKSLYFYNDMLVIACTFGTDTIIYQAQFNGTTYAIYSTEVKKGVTLIDAIGDSGTLYWITNNRIFGFQGGTSQEIRFLGYSDALVENFVSGKLAFIDGDLLIGNGTTVYIWGAKHAGKRNALITKTVSGTIHYITGNYVHTQSGTNTIYTNSSKYPNSGYTISLPYDAGINGVEKSELVMRIGYRLKTSTTIQIYVQTDQMNAVNPTTWVLVDTISDTTKRTHYIAVNQINDALATATYSSDWQEIRIKRVYNGGGGSSGLRDNTPRFYDLEFTHNITNEKLKPA